MVTLASGLIYLIRDQGRSLRTVKALTARIALSVAFLLLLLAAYALGLISPHDVIPDQPETSLPVDGMLLPSLHMSP